MATLILGTVGRVFGGPIGGIIGTAVGSLVDHGIFGGGRGREQGRISNPAVQSATYGEPIPIVVGRMRTAGNLIWTSGIREQAATAGGGKRSGGTTTYSYTASFAVGLTARRIVGVGRIWADGKLIRDAGGAFITPVTMRLHDGDPDQTVDPLIAAAEGGNGTPAYRGLAYAVFEDMPLADYGNRIPNLTFEIIADEGAIDAGSAVAGIAAAAGYQGLVVSGAFPALSGHIAGRVGSLAETLAPLIAIADASVVGHARLEVSGAGQLPVTVPADAGDAHRPGANRPADRRRRAAADTVAGCMELSFYDTTRDYQPGLQRVRRSAAAITDQRAISAAMSPVEAKALAVQLLTAGQAARSRQSLRLSWRHVGLVPGTFVRLTGANDVWRVREARFENFIVHLDLERTPAPTASTPVMAARAADGGRALAYDDAPAGPTTLLVLDLPPLPGDMPATPRLWVAGNGAGAGWRRAGVVASMDGGGRFTTLGVLDGGTVIGTAVDALADGDCVGWDRVSSVEVELLGDRDWLEARSAAAVLAGSNLALLGNELIQFAAADAVGPHRFRLHGLLRGRRGTEAATRGHQAGDRFVMIDPARMLALDPSPEMLGRVGLVRPVGSGDADAEAVSFLVAGAALRPLAPVHLAARWVGEDLVIAWVRRSRSGFGWTDFVDAPLGETTEAYVVAVHVAGRIVRQATVAVPHFVYSAADLAADGTSGTIEISVAQLSAQIGPGSPAFLTINTLYAEAV